jgi:hypothetical protein
MTRMHSVIETIPASQPFTTETDGAPISRDESRLSPGAVSFEKVVIATGELAIQAKTETKTDSSVPEEVIPLYASYAKAAEAALKANDDDQPPHGGGPGRGERVGDAPEPMPRLDRDERTLSDHETGLFADMQMARIITRENGSQFTFSLPHGAEADFEVEVQERRDGTVKLAKLNVDISNEEAFGIVKVGDIQRRLAVRAILELFDQKVDLTRMKIDSESDLLLYNEVFGSSMKYHGSTGNMTAQEALQAIRDGDGHIEGLALMMPFFMTHPQFTMIDKRSDNEEFLDYVDMYDLKPEPRIAKRSVRWRNPDWEEFGLDGSPNEDEFINVGDVILGEQIRGPLRWFMLRNTEHLGPHEGYNFELTFREHRDDWIRHVRGRSTDEDGYMFLTQLDARDDRGRKTEARSKRLGRYNFGPIRRGLVQKIHRLMNLNAEQARLLAGISRPEIGEEGSSVTATIDPVLQSLVKKTLEGAETEAQRKALIRELKETGRGYGVTGEVCERQGVDKVRAHNISRRRGVIMYHYLKPYEVARPQVDAEALLREFDDEQ